MPAGFLLVAGYPYWPQALKAQARRDAGRNVADEFHRLLKDGQLAEVRRRVAAQPGLLAQLLPIVANPDASINVRIGAGVIFEAQAGAAALRALLPQLGALSAHADARVRADACFYLGLTNEAGARGFVAARLDDPSADVREIAADALAMLPASS